MEKIKVSSFANVVTGGTPSTEKKEYWENGTIPWLQSGCCQNCFVTKASNYITEIGYKNSSAKLMPPNTVLIALTGATAGKVGYLTFEACGNQSITGILPNPSVDSKFLFYYLISKRDDILSDCVGGAQPHISQGYVKNILVPVYSLKQQMDMVKVLDLITDSIDESHKFITLLDELIKSKFNEMFSEYDRCKLCDIADITMGQSPSSSAYNDEGEGLPFFQGKADFGKKQTVVRHYSKEWTKTAKAGDVLMSVRAPVGPVNIASVDCCIGRGLCAINSKKGKANNEFLFNALSVMEDEISGMGTGSTFKAITKENVYNILLPSAPIQLQNDFSDYSHKIDDLKAEIQKCVSFLEELLNKKMNEFFGD